MNAPLTAEQWKRKVIQTRTYGATYIPVASRLGYEARFIASTRNKALAAIAKAERGWR